MVRPARPDEQPAFGQVWRWGDATPPIMCVAPDLLDGPVRHGFRGWKFLDLDHQADIRTWYWCDGSGQPFDDWLLIDE